MVTANASFPQKWPYKLKNKVLIYQPPLSENHRQMTQVWRQKGQGWVLVIHHLLKMWGKVPNFSESQFSQPEDELIISISQS